MQYACLRVAGAAQAAFDIEHAAEVAEHHGTAPLARMLAHFSSAMAVEMSPYLIENVPPKPQHASQAGISVSLTPGSLASRSRGCVFTPSSRRPEQASW